MKIQHPNLDDAVALPVTPKVHHVKRDGNKLVFKLDSPYSRNNEPEYSSIDYHIERDPVSDGEAAPGQGSTNQDANALIQQKIGSFYKVKCLVNNRTDIVTSGSRWSTNYDIRIGRLDSHNDHGGLFTILKFRTKNHPRSF